MVRQCCSAGPASFAKVGQLGPVVRQCNTSIPITMLVLMQTYRCCEALPACCCSVQPSMDTWHGWLIAVGCNDMHGVDECSPINMVTPLPHTDLCVHCLGFVPVSIMHGGPQSCTALQASCLAGGVMLQESLHVSWRHSLFVTAHTLLCCYMSQIARCTAPMMGQV